jgi:hypothetical protein
VRHFGVALLLIVLPLQVPLQAWNATGHRIVGAIAYDHLTVEARARVDELLRQHPDFKALMGGPEMGREAFLAASVWPDVIKGDNRFYDDTRADAQPTPLLPGFPSAGFLSMARHTNWHYVDIPFSPDGTSLEPAQSPNALIELRRILKEANLSAYDLPWLVHLTGDVHQPLHCTSRFTKSQPKGDQGGNLVYTTPGRNLHALWDDLAGADTTDAYVNRYATEITAEFVKGNGQQPRLSKDPKKWVYEGFDLAKREVYTFGPETGSREHPLPLPPGYEDNARGIARIQLAKAGFRLAAVLNAKLGQ